MSLSYEKSKLPFLPYSNIARSRYCPVFGGCCDLPRQFGETPRNSSKLGEIPGNYGKFGDTRSNSAKFAATHVQRSYPGSSMASNSTWLTPRACESSYSVTIVGLRRPCSRPLRYCWLNPDRSSTCSWVRPLARRMRAKFRPTSWRISMPPGSGFTHYEFINYSMLSAVGLLQVCSVGRVSHPAFDARTPCREPRPPLNLPPPPRFAS